ncbi:MAG: GtrA family protein [Bacteroidetes bacterium]|nr:GtrA family protein [Bacteroidota bacterium]
MQELIIKFIKFGIVGFSGVGVDFGTTWLCKEKMGINRYLANSIGFSAAVISNYILNRLWTFHSTDPGIALQFGKFLVVALVGLGLNNAILFWLHEQKGKQFYFSKLLATAIVMLWNFGANYLFTFKS